MRSNRSVCGKNLKNTEADGVPEDRSSNTLTPLTGKMRRGMIRPIHRWQKLSGVEQRFMKSGVKGRLVIATGFEFPARLHGRNAHNSRTSVLHQSSRNESRHLTVTMEIQRDGSLQRNGYRYCYTWLHLRRKEHGLSRVSPLSSVRWRVPLSNCAKRISGLISERTSRYRGWKDEDGII